MRRFITTALGAITILGSFSSTFAEAVLEAAATQQPGDIPAAVKALQLAAENGEARAQYELGAFYASPGPKQDLPQAAAWIHKAADQGYVRAEVVMGGMYAMGGGVSPDGVQARYWFTKAADVGSPEGQTGLAQIYARGLGVLEDDTLAFYWFRKAAEQEFRPAELNVAFDYANGRGVPQDKVQALMWLDLVQDQLIGGSSGGPHVSLVQRDKLAASMSAVQIDQARTLANGWLARRAATFLLKIP